MTALATVEDLVARYDERTIGEFAVDEEGVVLTHDEILEHPKLLKLVSASAGRVRADLMCGNRYKPEQLESLTGDDKEFLVDLICMVAMSRVFLRRPGLHESQSNSCSERAEYYLEQLRQGKNIFNLPEHRAVANPTVNGPTTVNYQTLNLMTEQCMARHYPTRDHFLPTDRG